MSFLYFLESIRNSFLDKFFLLITTLGEETLFIVIALVLMWCVDKYEGYYMVSIGFVGIQINQLLKVTFRIERPWIKDPNFKAVEAAIPEAAGYSFPSGHTQTAVGTFGAIARWTKNNALRIISIVLASLVAFSRMYLGVHTPLDVGVSLMVATVFVLAFYPVFKNVRKNPKIMYIFLGVMILWSIAQVVFMEIYPFPQEASAEELYHGLKNAYKMLGAVVGMAIVFHLDYKYIKYETKAVWWAQIIKVVLGMILSLGVKELFQTAFEQFLYKPAADCIAYFAMLLAAGALWPLTFKFFAKLGNGKK